MQILDKIISNFKNNKTLYIGEKITISDHMIQSAMLAEKAQLNDGGSGAFYILLKNKFR